VSRDYLEDNCGDPGSFQVNIRRSEEINSGTSGGSKRSGTRAREEYKRSACEDVKCDWKIS
jgi:hypothetical protein